MIKIKRDLNEILYRNKAFLNREEIDRPLFGIHIWGREHMKIFKETNQHIPREREVRPDDIVTEYFIRDMEKIVRMNEKIGGDILWPVVPHIYIPWMEAINGCPIFAGKTSFYTQPFVKKWDNFTEEVDLSENNKWLSKLLELQSALIDHFGSTHPVGSSSHLRGPADMVSSAIGQTEFCFELFDNPGKIEKMSSIFTKAFIKVARLQNSLALKSKFGGYAVNAYGIWSSDICQYFQDDAVIFLSPKLYREIILKYHKKIANSFNSTLYHLHPISLFVIDELIKMEKLAVIEINRDINGPPIKELIPILRKVQKNKKALLIDFTQGSVSLEILEEEIKILCKQLSFKGLGMRIQADDIEDAEIKLKIVKRILKI